MIVTPSTDRIVVAAEQLPDSRPARGRRLVISKEDLEPGPPPAPSPPDPPSTAPEWSRTRRGRLGLSAAAGVVAALVTWAASEPFLHGDRPDLPAIVWALGLMAGCTAFALGSLDRLRAGGRRLVTRSGLRAFALAAGLALLVALISHRWADSLLRTDDRLGLAILLARAMEWAPLGAAIGLAQGVVFGSRWKITRGILGGAVGAAAGGLCFLPAGALAGTPWLGRLFGLALVGALTGLGVGLSQEVRRPAWLVVTRGPLTGCEFVLHRHTLTIGAAPDCDIPLRGDPAVGASHAAIRAGPGGYYAEDLGSPTGTLVNGTLVRKQRLHNADSIGIGGTLFVYRERDLTATGVSCNGPLQAREAP